MANDRAAIATRCVAHFSLARGQFHPFVHAQPSVTPAILSLSANSMPDATRRKALHTRLKAASIAALIGSKSRFLGRAQEDAQRELALIRPAGGPSGLPRSKTGQGLSSRQRRNSREPLHSTLNADAEFDARRNHACRSSTSASSGS
jgi:hypothetical protein